MLRLRISPLARAIGIFSAVAIAVTGVTYAALNSQATLTSSTISTASAGLKLWDGDSFESSAPGFTITDLVPGTGVEKPVYFQNTGGVPLNLTAHVPTAPSASGFTGWNNLTVDIASDSPTCPSGDNVTHTNMASLLAGEVAPPCNPLAAGAQGNAGVRATEGNYRVKFDINPAAVSGDGATVGAFDIVFTGTQAASTTETVTP